MAEKIGYKTDLKAINPLKNEKVPYTIVTDNSGGFLMQKKNGV